MKNNICINVFGFSNLCLRQKFVDSMDLLLLTDNDKSHHVYIKDFDRFVFHKQKIKTKNGFVEVVYSVLVAKMC